MSIVQPGTDQIDFGGLLLSLSPTDRQFILRDLDAIRRILDAALARLDADEAAVPVGANPTAVASSVAVDGAALTFMRSDAAPAVQVGSTAHLGLVQPDGVTIVITNGGVISSINGPQGSVQNSYLVSGGVVAWQTGYTYTVSAAVYFIAGVQHTSVQQSITLAAADPTNPRIDVIAVDDTGTVVAIQGTAAINPSEPDIDPGSQLTLAFVLVGAGSTQPAGVTTTALYAEDAGSPAEWNWSTSGAGWTLNATADPHSGTKYIDGTTVAKNSWVQGQIGSGSFDPSTASLLVFWLKSKVLWGSKFGLQISLRSGGVLVGSAVTIASSGTFGFSSSNVATYQLVAVPMGQFAVPAGATINQIRFADFGGSISLELDDISFQANGSTQPQPGLTKAEADTLYAPINAAYIIVAPNNTTLNNERALTAGNGISFTDHGANDIFVVACTVVGSDPSATASDTAVAGTAGTFMRSDGAPAIRKSSSTVFGIVKVDNVTIVSTAGVVGVPTGVFEPAKTLNAINTQTASYTLVIGDAGALVEMNLAGANNLTIPPNSSVAFAVNTRVDIVQYGAGQTTVVAGAGVTIRSVSGNLKLAHQYSGALLYKRDTDEWVLVGDLSA